jgi:NADH-quinone oxidoreductase subunit A
MTPLAAILLLFVAVGAGFILVHLLVGKLIRPARPGGEKDTIYECGEPTIGSAWIQFDLRFYVVALLFVIFDVEVAFFFPWAEVFGKANAIANAEKPADAAGYREYARKILDLNPPPASRQDERNRGDYQDLAQVSDEELEARLARDTRLTQPFRIIKAGGFEKEFQKNQEASSTLAWLAFFEIVVFFGVLLVGFAYLWRRGDLAWVRSVQAERTAEAEEAVSAAAGNGASTSIVAGPSAGIETVKQS